MSDKLTNYEPFGIEWKKEIMKLPIHAIVDIFDIDKREGESKSEYVDRIALTMKT